MNTIKLLLVIISMFVLLSACSDEENTQNDQGAHDFKTEGTVPKDGSKTEGTVSKDGSMDGTNIKCPKILKQNITKDTIIPALCTVEAPDGVDIKNNATLTVMHGATIKIGSSMHFMVGSNSAGRLVTKGTQAAPVTITSLNASPGPGDWNAVDFESKTMDGTNLDYTIIEYGGKTTSYPAIRVGFGVQSSRISITNCTLRDNASGGVLVQESTFTFKKFTGNTLKNKGTWSMSMPPEAVGSLGTGNTFGAPLQIITGTVTKSATWRKFDAIYNAIGTVTVGSKGSGTLLTFEDGVTMTLGSGAYFRVGKQLNQAGGLVAKKVTFKSSVASPSKGDWYYLEFGISTMTSKLDGCTITHGGKDTKQVVRIEKVAVNKVDIVNTTFKDNDGDTDILIPYSSSTVGLCDKYTKSSAGNTFDLKNKCSQS